MLKLFLVLCFMCCCCVPCCAVPAAGKLTDTRQRFLGTRPPRLFSVSVRGERSLLALSSRPWLGYSDMGRWQFMPLSYEALDHAAVRLDRERWVGAPGDYTIKEGHLHCLFCLSAHTAWLYSILQRQRTAE